MQSASIQSGDGVAERATAAPPRYWRLKRILPAVAIVLVLLGLARWRWAAAAQRRLDAVVAEIQSRGERLFFGASGRLGGG